TLGLLALLAGFALWSTFWPDPPADAANAAAQPEELAAVAAEPVAPAPPAAAAAEAVRPGDPAAAAPDAGATATAGPQQGEATPAVRDADLTAPAAPPQVAAADAVLPDDPAAAALATPPAADAPGAEAAGLAGLPRDEG